MAVERTLSSLISSNPLDVFCILFLILTALFNAKYRHRRNGTFWYLVSLAVLGSVEALFVQNGRYHLALFSIPLVVCVRRMCVPAVTGGIGSGKSTLVKVMADHGFSVIDCDAINRELLLPGSPAYASIIRKFGATIVKDNGEIDRAQLRELVFNDESKRLQLNKCLHTYIGLRVICNIFKHRILHWRSHVVMDVPLLYNTPLVLLTGPVVVVTASKESRLERLGMRESSIPRSTLLNIMKAQVPDSVLTSWGDIILENNGTLDSFMEQAEALITRLKRLI